nr:ribonuclease H-like domain-containing protein [Tanacetum cinerariifolium]
MAKKVREPDKKVLGYVTGGFESRQVASCFRCVLDHLDLRYWSVVTRSQLITFKLEGTENYKVWSGAVQLALHTRNKLGFINGKCHRLDDDAFFKINGIGASALKEHRQLLRLMQFLMGLDDVYGLVRSQILTTKPLPGVKSAFATLSRDESHKTSYNSHNSNKTGPTAYATKSNDWNANKMKKGVDTQNVSSNAAVSGHKVDQRTRQTSLHTFTDDQFQKLIALICEKSGSGSVHANVTDSGASQHMTYTTLHMFNLVNVTKLNMSVGHPNGTNAQVTHIGCLKFSDTITLSDVLVVPDYHVSLLSVPKLSKDNKLRVIFDGSQCLIQDFVLRTLVGTGSEHSGMYFFDTGSQPTVEEPQPSVIPDNQDILLRRSSRKSSMPAKFSDFKINTKVKYNIDNHVNYSRLSSENFSFSAGINKFYEPKCYTEASSDTRWVDAMNLEMGTLLKNGTWIIADLLVGRKAIGCKWVYKIKYKYNGKVERFKARLVAKGYNQIEAFLYGELVEDVYMKLPEGYFDNNDTRVCKLRKYCMELLTEFGMLGCKPCNTLIEVKEGIIKKDGTIVVDNPLSSISSYQKLVVKLIYCTHTRPDISYDVHVLSQYMHAPMESHLRRAFRVLRYLKNAPGMGITFNKSNDLCLNVFVYSDWAKCKSTRRSKHFEIELFFLREKVAAGVVKTMKVKSEDNIADLFTKGLYFVDHLQFCRNAGYERQRSGTVAGAINTVGSSMVQKFRIQCYNCKEYGHVAREC